MSVVLDTLVVTLLWTNPSAKAQQVVIPIEERDTPSDSLSSTCLPGDPLFDLDSVRVYAWPSTGGYRRRVYAKSVRGREALPDSVGPLVFPGWTGAHFDVTFTRIGSTRESCESNRVWKGLPLVTGVDPDLPRQQRVVEERWFDVHGRAIDIRRHTGLAWARWTVRGRFIGRQQVVFWRGRALSEIRRPKP